MRAIGSAWGCARDATVKTRTLQCARHKRRELDGLGEGDERQLEVFQLTKRTTGGVNERVGPWVALGVSPCLLCRPGACSPTPTSSDSCEDNGCPCFAMRLRYTSLVYRCGVGEPGKTARGPRNRCRNAARGQHEARQVTVRRIIVTPQ